MSKTLIALALAVFPLVDATSQLVVASSSCTGGLELEGLHVDCNGECVFGGSASLSGLVLADEKIPKYIDTKLQYSLFGHGIKTIEEHQDIKTCDAGVLSPPAGEDAGYYCPQAGEYNFHINRQNIFGSIESWYSKYYWYNFSVLFTIYDAGDYDPVEFAQCTLTIHTKKSSQYNSDGYVAGAALAGVSLLGIMGVLRRRRRARTLIEMDEDLEGTQAHFEMMHDPTATVV